MLSLISSLSLKLCMIEYLRVFLESLRRSSVIFGNFRKMFGNVRATFGQISENLRKSSENRQLRRHYYVYIIKRTFHVSSKI